MRGIHTPLLCRRGCGRMTVVLGLLYGVILVNIAIQLCRQNADMNLAIDRSLASLNTANTARKFVTRLKKDIVLQTLVKQARLKGGLHQAARIEEAVSRMLQKLLRSELRLDIQDVHSNSIRDQIQQSIHENSKSVLTERPKVSYLAYSEFERYYFGQNQLDLELALASIIQESGISVYDPQAETISENEIRVSLKHSIEQQKLDYYHNIITGLLLKHRPEEKAFTPEELGNRMLAQYYCLVQDPPLSRRFLQRDHLHPRNTKFVGLRETHANLMRDLRKIADPPRVFVNGDGIVIGAYGGSSLGSALVAIMQIREMGSNLPIEVVIATENHYSTQICDILMPYHFNAKCIVIEREIGGATLEYMKITRAQLKVFGLLFTSFDNTIYIDENTLVLKNIDSLIYSEPYLLSKFIMWPDVWHRTTSPFFYDIAGIKPGWPTRRDGAYNARNWSDYAIQSHSVDVAFHDLEGVMPGVTIESGQMVFSKRAHFKSLLLATYYTIFGPTFFWPLLYQNIDGPTSRDTFLPALTVMNEQYHVVGRESWHAGYTTEDPAQFHETAIVQHDPHQSAEFMDQWESWLADVKGLDPRLSPYQCNKFTHDLKREFVQEQQRLWLQDLQPESNSTAREFQLPDAMFIRNTNHRINPAKVSEEDGEATVIRRYLGKLGTFPELGHVDWELKFHAIEEWLACEGITSYSFWNEFSKIGQKESCQVSQQVVKYLMRDSTDVGARILSVV